MCYVYITTIASCPVSCSLVRGFVKSEPRQLCRDVDRYSVVEPTLYVSECVHSAHDRSDRIN